MTTSVTRNRFRLYSGIAVGTLALILLAVIPFLKVTTGGFLPGALNSPGSLQVLAVVLIIAALATSYDIVLGYAGLFSFGHALYFALGSYTFAMMMAHTEAGVWSSVGAAILVTVVGALLVNAVALRAKLIAFSMVTLAVTQVAFIFVSRNYFGTGGDEGLSVPFAKMPTGLVGIVNTRNIYWLALGLLVFVFAVSMWITSTRLGHTWQAVRENELRVQVMGQNVYLYKLSAIMVGSTLAGVCGIVYTIALGSADPQVTGIFYSLGLIVMLIIGGKGRIWGAVLGGAIYTSLEQRLPTLAASEAVDTLPVWLKIPLSEPTLLIGVIFIIFIFALPGGLASIIVKFIDFLGSKLAPGRDAPPAATDSSEPATTQSLKFAKADFDMPEGGQSQKTY